MATHRKHLVESAAFRRWFEGSKVATRSGVPRRVYHGTRSPVNFTVFETGDIFDDAGELLIGGAQDPGTYLGPHFAESFEVASRFACGKAAPWDSARSVARGDCGGRVIPVYLAIRKPRRFDSDEALVRFICTHGESSEIEDEIQARIEDGDLVESHGKLHSPRGDAVDRADLVLSIVRKFARIEPDDAGPPFVCGVLEALAQSAREAMRAQGYDGGKYQNTVEGGGWAWIAFSTRPVKFALDARNPWDSSGARAAS